MEMNSSPFVSHRALQSQLQSTNKLKFARNMEISHSFCPCLYLSLCNINCQLIIFGHNKIWTLGLESAKRVGNMNIRLQCWHGNATRGHGKVCGSWPGRCSGDQRSGSRAVITFHQRMTVCTDMAHDACRWRGGSLQQSRKCMRGSGGLKYLWCQYLPGTTLIAEVWPAAVTTWCAGMGAYSTSFVKKGWKRHFWWFDFEKKECQGRCTHAKFTQNILFSCLLEIFANHSIVLNTEILKRQ